ncbi:para-nitrobenzyl esterase [Labedaea rhizosphaerae]|uniref:Carboxylic ester hydrolase n=2 Tax=Labedaea rhizosphaerae TaxID=598644 RepID=A0A4R6RXW5_LABRH|nr:para-nitrobenzyl esterase [Labedaea rhizosphaerae]
MAPIVELAQGALRGKEIPEGAVFLGVPYAAPPVGALRFREPAPVEPWQGVRDATDYSATAPKPPYAKPFDRLLDDPVKKGDDYLTVNLWTPDPDAAGLPVMVWIHGGAFRNGSNMVPWYDGAAFARDGVVLVSVNYRLGVEGFALFPDAPPNRGILDQLAALEWVRDNVSAFGGDPARVTIFGESAGGMSVTTLMSLPQAQGLFRGVIAQSGAGHTVAKAEDARLVTGELAAMLGVEPTAAAVAEVDRDHLVDTQAALAMELTRNPDPGRWGPSVVASTMAFLPVQDGTVIARRPVDAIADGAGADVALMTGTTAHEFRFFLQPVGLIDAMSADGLRAWVTARGWDPAIIDAYTAAVPGSSPGDVLAALRTDSFFRVPAARLAEAHSEAPAPTYLYEFTWETPLAGMGSCHALEIPFVFDGLAGAQGRPLYGDDLPQSLADAMHGAWVAFAKDLDPGWTAFDPDKRTTMVFGRPETGPVQDPHAALDPFWQGVV